MGSVISLHGDPHADTQRLMPWYATGAADPADVALVDAHLATCAECRAELSREQRLRELIAGTSPEQASGWAALRARAEAPIKTRTACRTSPRQLGWLAAASVAAACLVTATVSLRTDRPARYEALGASEPMGRGNIIVVFDPDVRERDVRRALLSSDARLIDGPTAANAYVLEVAPARRVAALAVLRGEPGIVMAEPIGADPGR